MAVDRGEVGARPGRRDVARGVVPRVRRVVPWFGVPVIVGLVSLPVPLGAELASPDLGTFFGVLEVLWPLALLALMVGLTHRVRCRHDDDSGVRFAGWCLTGWLFVGGLGLLLVGHQVDLGVGVRKPWVVVNDMAISGAALGLLVGRYDVERRAEYAEVRRLNRRLEFLNDLLGHDVRNDVAVIDAYARELAAEYGPDERFDRIGRKADHITDLIRVAGELNETEATDGELGPVDLSAVLRRAVEQAREGFPEATVRVEGELPDAAVRGDSLVGSVFDNLLRNAVQHGGEAPEVVVSATAFEDAVRVRVADDGPGVPRSIREDLFAEGTAGERSGGTGLGLYLVRRLLDRYDGRIEVGENDPTGTVFTVRLPRSG